jgi:pimeloyl-ACP methyl ester carboxylesterase
MSYELYGKGKPLVLLHGAFSYDSFGEFKYILAKKYKVYVLHLPGFGASDTVPWKRHNTDLFAEVLGAFLRKLKLQKATIMSLSLGTIVSLKAAARGYTTGSLILIGMPGKVSGIIPRIIRFIPLPIIRYIISTEWGRKKLLVPAMKENLNSGDEETIHDLLSTTDAKAVADIDYVKEVERDLPKALKKISNKKIFVYGEHDPLISTTKHLIPAYFTIREGHHSALFQDTNLVLSIIKDVM